MKEVTSISSSIQNALVKKYGIHMTRWFIPSVRPTCSVAAIWLLCCLVAPASLQARISDLQSVVESCSTDLDGDRQQDLVLQVATASGFDTIALLHKQNGYRVYLLSRRAESMKLTCEVGRTVRSTAAGAGSNLGHVYQTPGAFVSLKQPEGSAVSYFWTGKTFREIWTSD